MPASKDYYQTLGVAKGASEAEIKKAYKKLARENHPDLNPNNPAAEKRFKEISEAYAVLSDSEKRAKYDRFGSGEFGDAFSQAWGRAHQGGGFDPSQMHDFGFNLDDILGDIFKGAFRGARRSHPQPRDLEMELPLSFLEAVNGTQKGISLDGSVIDVRIPSGVENNAKIRIAGKGQNGGDLYLITKVMPHPFFRRVGDQIEVDLPISLKEALAGATVPVPTIDGAVDLKIPAGSSSGQKMKLKGKGVIDPRSKSRGDQIVTLQVTVPKLNDRERQAVLDALSQVKEDSDLRAKLKVHS